MRVPGGIWVGSAPQAKHVVTFIIEEAEASDMLVRLRAEGQLDASKAQLALEEILSSVANGEAESGE
jgi:hypothetical protein